MVRGFSLRSESTSACRTIFASHNDFDLLCIVCHCISSLEGLSRIHQQVLKNRPQAQRREKCQRADDDDHAYQQAQ